VNRAIPCPSCGHDNREEARFCDGCGTALARVCPRCGTTLRAAARFCDGCGQPVSGPASASPAPVHAHTPKHLAEKILTARAALEGERKQVTVLVADVKSSMELAEQLDPEEWHRIIARFFQLLAEGVHHFEGTVNQYTGDGIMALFGAPIAHEDHAQRACWAALHLQEVLRGYAREVKREHGLAVSARMGLDSGEVVVGKIGDDLRMHYTALGHTVGLAKRMEQLADPGSVYLTDHTARLVEGWFRLQDLGTLAVKGVREPPRVYELQGIGPLRTRLDAARSRGFSRLVGRDPELAALEEALDQASAARGQVVGVVAPAGTGKSRLCAEFAGRCRARGIQVAEAHCPTIGKNVPFLPLLELLRDLFGIAENDSPHEARRKIAGELMLSSGRDFQEVVPLVFDLLGVRDPHRPVPSMDPEARKRKLLTFVRHLVQARSAREPILIFLDDVHWIDSGSDEFLAQVVEAAGGTRTLVLVNFRPGYHAEWTTKSYYRQLPLGPLGPEASRELLEDLIGRHPSVALLSDRIRERTGGNPFFTEEVARSLVESGILEGRRGDYRLVRPIEELKIPATVQAVLAARIDRLPEGERALLQTAAVIGKEFPRAILERVTDLAADDLSAALAGLERAEFIFERTVYPDEEYAFRHPLTQEVALQSLLSDRRARLHAAVARAVEVLRADRLDEEAGALAHHWEEAGEPLEGARWHRRAARWTEETDPSESLRRWHKVRTLLAHATESPETTPLRLEACRGILSAYWRVGGSEVDSVFAEGKVLAEQTGDLGLLAILYNVYGNAKGTAGDLRAYYEHASEALRLAERTGDPVIQAAIASDAHPFCWTGRLREAVLLTEKAIALGPEDLSLGRDLFGVSAYLCGLMFRGTALVEMGRLEEAASDLDRASRHPAEQPTPFIWSQAYHVVRTYRSGDVSGALTHARPTLERAEEVGSPIYQVLAQVALGIGLLTNREWSAAEEAERRALALARERGVGFGITAWALCFQAEARLGQGDPRTALELADEALADARQSGGRLFEMDALLMRARALLGCEAADCAAGVEGTLAEASALIHETGARCREPVVHEVRADLARVLGDEPVRQRELREAHRLFTEIGATGHARRIEPLLR
jgi:class 3 adenylate cyclase/tetratricopeptide (TPR) repeat protein